MELLSTPATGPKRRSPATANRDREPRAFIGRHGAVSIEQFLMNLLYKAKTVSVQSVRGT